MCNAKCVIIGPLKMGVSDHHIINDGGDLVYSKQFTVNNYITENTFYKCYVFC